jgi:hypothetical protein
MTFLSLMGHIRTCGSISVTYFEMYLIQHHQWLPVASLYFTGHAALWWQAYKRCNAVPNWETLCAAYKGRIWIGSNSALQTKLISAMHSSAVGGRFGVQATYQHVRKQYYWPGIKQVEEWVKQCQLCQ